MISRSSLAICQFLFCLFMLAASIFFEIVVKLTPCVLCLVQRTLVALLLIVALVTVVRVFKHKKVFYLRIISTLISILGLAVSGRHIWLQQNADAFKSMTCLPDISYMLKVMTIPEIISRVISHAGAECAKVDWSFLGLSMPFWVGVLFLLYITSQLVSIRLEKSSSIKS